jgi:hypothetical protein
MSTDRLYQQPHEQIRNFAFTAQVAEVFADMVQRSVPGYGAAAGAVGTAHECGQCLL